MRLAFSASASKSVSTCRASFSPSASVPMARAINRTLAMNNRNLCKALVVKGWPVALAPGHASPPAGASRAGVINKTVAGETFPNKNFPDTETTQAALYVQTSPNGVRCA